MAKKKCRISLKLDIVAIKEDFNYNKLIDEYFFKTVS